MPTDLPPVERLIYIAVLLTGLMALFGAAAWVSQGRHLPNVHAVVLAGVVVAVVGLVRLHPRRALYSSGAVCLALAFFALWVVRPGGGVWGTDKAFLGFSPLFVLFPLAWTLMAASVASWKMAISSYLLAGLVFVLALLGISAAWSGTSAWNAAWHAYLLLTLFALNWPFYALILLGMFGHSFG